MFPHDTTGTAHLASARDRAEITPQRRTGAATLLHRLGAKLAGWYEQGRIVHELGQLSTRELADLGLVVSDIPAVARGTRRRT